MRKSQPAMTTQIDLAEALIRMFGRDALRQARENAASNARAGDTASEKMWLGVAEIVNARQAALAKAK
jgi:hypothetical protein